MSGYLDQRIELEAAPGNVHTLEWTLTVLTSFVVQDARLTVRNVATLAQILQLTVDSGGSADGQIVSSTPDATKVGFTDHLVRFNLTAAHTTGIGAERFREFDVDVLNATGDPVTAAAGLMKMITAGVP